MKKKRTGNEKWPQAIRDKALMEYIDGNTMRSVAEKHEIPMATLCTWHMREGWKALRKEAERVKRKTIFDKLTAKIEQNATQFLEAARIMSAMSCRSLKAHYDNQKDLEVDIKEWPKILAAMASAQKNIVPTFSEELADIIVEDLENGKDEDHK